VGGGTLEITALSDSIIHLVFTPAGAIAKTKQFAVLPQGRSSGAFTERREEKSVTLSTAKVQIKFSLEKGALQFLDGNGKVLLQEFEGNGEPEQVTRKFVKTTVNGEATFNVTNVFLPAQDEAFYGLGQHQAGVMNLRGEYVPLRQENTDVSIPVMISTRGYGMFWNNASPSSFDNRFPSLLKWNSEVGESVDYYFFYGPGMDQIIAGYRELTGRVPTFPKWAYGFFQSKDHYENQGEVLEIAAEYRRRHIPLDVIVQDWRWWITQGEGEFRPNYGDPEGMMNTLHDQHIRGMISVWPYFDKKDQGSYRQEMANNGAFVSGTTLIDPSVVSHK
jgi:alpha-D-xyloside xylohydrolase